MCCGPRARDDCVCGRLWWWCDESGARKDAFLLSCKARGIAIRVESEDYGWKKRGNPKQIGGMRVNSYFVV